MAEEKNEKHEKNEKKEKKDKKPNIFERAKRSVRDMRGEIKKVVWPTKKQIINNTGIVIVVVAFSGAAIGALDFVLRYTVDFLLRVA